MCEIEGTEIHVKDDYKKYGGINYGKKVISYMECNFFNKFDS